MVITNQTKTSVSQALADVNQAARADIDGTGKAHSDLLESIQKLRLAAEKPEEILMRQRFEPMQTVAIIMAIEAGLLQAVWSKKGQPVTADALASITGYDALLIARIMRLVTYVGYCNEVGESEYAANEVTRLVNTPAMMGAERHHFLYFPVAAVLPQYMRETGVHQFPSRPEDPGAFCYGNGLPFWEYLDQNPQDRRDFDEIMSGRRKAGTSWHDVYPMAEMLCQMAGPDPNAVLLVDVGGNKGHEIASFHEAHANMPGRLILQDLPSMIESVSKSPPKGIELMAYDFFTPQPVKGALAYYFRNILHNWSDAQCQTILINTAKSMKKGYSRILLDEYVVPNTGASFRAAGMDLLMMMGVCGIERTRHHWERLLDASGLEICKVWGLSSGQEQIIECQLKS